MALVDFFLVRDRPGLAGYSDFDTGDGSDALPTRRCVSGR
jgi:hypothetical protein